GLALFVRNVNDRERLHKLETDYQGQLDYFRQVFQDQQNELARLRGMSLELLKAQTAVRGRLNGLVESPARPAELPAVPPAPDAAPPAEVAPLIPLPPYTPPPLGEAAPPAPASSTPAAPSAEELA